jgi:glycosyltransferase involved in cell wall biosynthesis
MASCDIGVLSSVSEGLPLALLEYGIAGLSVVVTDVGDCSSVVDAGRAGKLVSPQSPEDLARAIIELLSNSLLRIEMSQKFSLRVKTKYSPDVILDQLENIYFSLFLEDGPPFLPGKVVQNRRE